MRYKVKIEIETSLWCDGLLDKDDAQNEVWYRLFDDYNSGNWPEGTKFSFEPTEDDEL